MNRNARCGRAGAGLRGLSGYSPLPRATFNRWRDSIFSQFGIIISCRRSPEGYLYYIENPEEIDGDKLKKWMLDTFALGNLIGENMALNKHIMLDPIPSGREHLMRILEAMKVKRVVNITYMAFTYSHPVTFPVEPYCVKLFENRWYLLGHNLSRDTMRLYGLDRIESVELTDGSYSMPPGF